MATVAGLLCSKVVFFWVFFPSVGKALAPVKEQHVLHHHGCHPGGIVILRVALAWWGV